MNVYLVKIMHKVGVLAMSFICGAASAAGSMWYKKKVDKLSKKKEP